MTSHISGGHPTKLGCQKSGYAAHNGRGQAWADWRPKSLNDMDPSPNMIVRKCQYGILNHPPHPICCDSIHQGRREEALQIHISIVEGSSIKQEAKSRRKSCKNREKPWE
ncbi:unnamed protein product [Cuscuta europaea]|uniref:Uncharacterized protein n=1 Tax=Cuscuta europaea TaxID=41803 RepID=A0A9P0ZIC0_CUSEU|nr:unnamed protein product [Cuscuta europaea]